MYYYSPPQSRSVSCGVPVALSARFDVHHSSLGVLFTGSKASAEERNAKIDCTGTVVVPSGQGPTGFDEKCGRYYASDKTGRRRFVPNPKDRVWTRGEVLDNMVRCATWAECGRRMNISARKVGHLAVKFGIPKAQLGTLTN